MMTRRNQEIFGKWKSDVEPTARAERVEYSSPDRGIASDLGLRLGDGRPHRQRLRFGFARDSATARRQVPRS